MLWRCYLWSSVVFKKDSHLPDPCHLSWYQVNEGGEDFLLAAQVESDANKVILSFHWLSPGALI